MPPNNNNNLIISIIAILFNYLFCIILPPLFSNKKVCFITKIKKNYSKNKYLISLISLYIGIVVYLSLINNKLN